MSLKKLLSKFKKPKKYIMIIDGKTYIISDLKLDGSKPIIEGKKMTLTTEDLE